MDWLRIRIFINLKLKEIWKGIKTTAPYVGIILIILGFGGVSGFLISKHILKSTKELISNTIVMGFASMFAVLLLTIITTKLKEWWICTVSLWLKMNWYKAGKLADKKRKKK